MSAPVLTPHGSVCESIETEVARATGAEIVAYLDGASREGACNRSHRTFQISQSDTTWLDVLGSLLERLETRSWTYRDGTGMRGVWVLETMWHRPGRETILTPGEAAAFVRGHFDAEGVVRGRGATRFSIRFAHESQTDLVHVRGLLRWLGMRCGRLHNPGTRQGPDAWHFDVLAGSHAGFIKTVGSWHPRKRALLTCAVPPAVVCVSGRG
ncbi:MAG: hypothetical protein QN178_14705 [Armatimonadota bacterium]|nr:hypothetical protein [Armatimonadota bacterium]